RPAIPADDRIHDGVVELAEDAETRSQHAFPQGAELLGHALTPAIVQRRDDLDTLDVRVLESPVDDPPRRFGGDTAPGGAGPDPVTEIGEPGLRVDTAQPAGAEKRRAGIEDAELVNGAVVAAAHGRVDPRCGVGRRVIL